MFAKITPENRRKTRRDCVPTVVRDQRSELL